MSAKMSDDIEKILFTREDIAQAVEKLGERISHDYEGKDLLLVCVLKGASVFMSDLIRAITIPCKIDFMDVSSYGAGARSMGHITLEKDVSSDVTGKNVLLIEDIIDSGISMSSVVALMVDRGCESVRVCTLFDKPEGRKVEFKADYVGLEVPHEFIVGYGLDYNEEYRNLPYIGVLARRVYETQP